MSLMKKTIADYMSSQAHTIRDTESVEHAKESMIRWGIRHLPVLSGGKLVGIISDRDIKSAAGWKGFDAKTSEVADICHQEVYVTHPTANLGIVAKHMAAERYGCSVVTDSDEKVVGVFTTTDACRALSEVVAH